MSNEKGKAGRQWAVGSLLLLLTGCSPGTPKYLGGNLNAVNHTSAAINSFSVNGYGGGNASPNGYGGSVLCDVAQPMVAGFEVQGGVGN